MPTTGLPGTGASRRMLGAARARARSFASAVMRCTRTPGAGRRPNCVTVGPDCTSTTSAATLNEASVSSIMRARASLSTGTAAAEGAPASRSSDGAGHLVDSGARSSSASSSMPKRPKSGGGGTSSRVGRCAPGARARAVAAETGDGMGRGRGAAGAWSTSWRLLRRVRVRCRTRQPRTLRAVRRTPTASSRTVIRPAAAAWASVMCNTSTTPRASTASTASSAPGGLRKLVSSSLRAFPTREEETRARLAQANAATNRSTAPQDSSKWSQGRRPWWRR